MMVVAELDDPFCPAPEDLLVNLGESREAVDALLDMLPNAFAETQQVESCMGPAVQAAYMAMNHIGGKLLMFQSTLPSLGSGRLLNRGDDHRSAGTDKEHLARSPADPFFKKIAAECSRQQICVDVFASASPYADLASLSTLPRYTGGQVYHYPAFRVERDGPRLSKELRHNLTRFTAWEAVCRVRCSKGFRVSSFNGHFFIRSMDLLALPATNADQAYAVQIAHDEQLPTTNTSFLQCALLYTNDQGERRIRVHTMCVPVVSDVAQMYRAVDGGAMSAFLTRLGVERSLTARLQDAREAMQTKLSSALKEFRMLNTSAARAFNRLIYPEKMRLIPLFALCAGKSVALRGQTRDVSVDERIASVFEIMSAPTEAILRRLYPGDVRAARHASRGGDQGRGGARDHAPANRARGGAHRRARGVPRGRRVPVPAVAREDARPGVRRGGLRARGAAGAGGGLFAARGGGVQDERTGADDRGGDAETRGERVPLHADGDPPGPAGRGEAVPAPRRGQGRGGRGRHVVRGLSHPTAQAGGAERRARAVRRRGGKEARRGERRERNARRARRRARSALFFIAYLYIPKPNRAPTPTAAPPPDDAHISRAQWHPAHAGCVGAFSSLVEIEILLFFFF
jgi:hypothetical protein